MRVRPFILRLIAFLVVAAISTAPFGDAFARPGMSATSDVASMSTDDMAGMDIAGMDVDRDGAEMPCCPDEMPKSQPASDCAKSACPSMASCTQQCIPAAASTEPGLPIAPGRAGLGRPPLSGALSSLLAEPPPRPPRA